MFFGATYICPKFTIFTKMDIKELGRQLKVRRLMAVLFTRVAAYRPTLSPNTLYRAFSEPECHTELLRVIRQEGQRLLEEQNAAAEAA